MLLKKMLLTPVILFPLLCGFFDGESPPEPVREDPGEKSRGVVTEERIRELVSWLREGDADLSVIAQKELLSIGRQAVPHLEKAIEKKGAGELLQTLRKILLQDKESSEWVTEEAVDGIEEELARQGMGLSPSQRDAYVRSRFCEAMILRRKGKYEKAYGFIQHLIALEPRSRFREQMEQFSRWCDQKIIHASLVKPVIVAPVRIADSGNQLRFKLRIEGISSQTVRLHFVSPEEEDSGEDDLPGRVILTVKVRILDLLGIDKTHVLHSTVFLEKMIEIEPGSYWEKEVVFDIKGVPSSDFFREYHIHARTLPREIEVVPGRKVVKKIVFEPKVVKVIPEKYGSFLDDPLAWFKSAIEKGTVHEVCLAALLLQGEERREGRDLLLKARKSARTSQAAGVIHKILAYLSDEKPEKKPTRWQEWIKSKMEKKEAGKSWLK